MTDPTVFDRYASNYTETVNAAIGASGENAAFFARLKVELVRRAVGSLTPRKILDFGCGIGSCTRELAETFPSALVIGCDASPGSIIAAQQATTAAFDRVRFVVHDGSGLPFRDSTFDLAFTAGVFHHIGAFEHPSWFRELHRLLASTAPLFLFEHNPYNPLTRRVVNTIPFDEGVELLRPRSTAAIVRSVGFHATRPRYYFFFPRALRWLRPIEVYLDWLPLGGQYYIVGWRTSSRL